MRKCIITLSTDPATPHMVDCELRFEPEPEDFNEPHVLYTAVASILAALKAAAITTEEVIQ